MRGPTRTSAREHEPNAKPPWGRIVAYGRSVRGRLHATAERGQTERDQNQRDDDPATAAAG